MNYPLPNQSKKYFRSIGELENSPEFDQFLQREFPTAASEFPEGVSRRRWIQLMGASLAFGGASGCRYNREQFAEFASKPEGRVAGVPQYFTTNFEWAGRAVHVLAKCLEGRPIKLDGNAQHPIYAQSVTSEHNDGKEAKFESAGTDTFTQAAVLSLYDPDRLGSVLHRESKRGDFESSDDDQVADWTSFTAFAAEQAKSFEASKGKGLAIVFEPSSSPSWHRWLADTKAKFPEAAFVEYESVYRRNQSKAINASGGGKASSFYRLDKAKVIVSVDDNLLGSDPNSVVYARQFAMNRGPSEKQMNRLYAIESQYSITGAAADFRLAIKSSQAGLFLDRLEALIDAGKTIEGSKDEKPYNELIWQEKLDRTLQTIATDLLANKGNSLLTVGAHQEVDVQQTAIRINAKLGNFGKTWILLDIPNASQEIDTIRLDDFVHLALGTTESGKAAPAFKTAWLLVPNPVFTLAGDIALSGALENIPSVVYAADTDDETAQLADWVVPAAHPLEAWGDVRAVDGTYGVGQPQIESLRGGKSLLEIGLILSGATDVSSTQYVRNTATEIAGGSLSDRQWKEILHAGFLASSAAKPAEVKIATDKPTITAVPGAEAVKATTIDLGSDSVDELNLEIVVHPSDSVYDGRFANNGWLQELPQPITKLTWDNAAIMSIRTARKLGLKQGELVHLTQGEASVRLPVFVVPGHAEGSIAINVGYGRSRAGSVGGAVRSPKDTFTVGTNLASLRRWNQHSILTGVSAKGTSIPYKLSTTQDHFAIDDEGGMREIAARAPQLVREGTLEEFSKAKTFAKMHLHHEDSMWKEPAIDQHHAWGMTIDLNKCIGCNACVVACQAENNVPIVGKEQVSRGREMHWLRIDRYFQCDYDVTEDKGDFRDPIDPKIVQQPMACAHCETAPCEQVCPVAATVHTEEGINAMAYNRCIGTRYCANNCPYKVRRFNYFNFNQQYGYFYGWNDNREKANAKLQQLVLNPEVTVRGRGVMEKCTYCIQRVQNGKIKARATGDGLVHDGDIRTACQDACASQAIVFGDLNDKTSRVYAMQHDPRAYGLLEDLNIKPRTLYLARVRNVPRRLMTYDQINPQWNTSPDRHGSHDHSHGETGHDNSHEEAKANS
ncbi:MAG: TAT-variant-translocated molybdopterin oxidoreductase [Pirellulaceae bacterium]|nr:TAT-variant-translocated molybdopterin oxidoreductase [Pirellulaceae bacterium]